MKLNADNETGLRIEKLPLRSRALILLAVILFAWAGQAAAQTIKPEKSRLKVGRKA